MPGNTSDPDHIERDLDRTRSRLGSHLSELQDRLSPGQVIDDLMGYFRGSEGADFGRNLLESVRGNPLPAALTGIGLAWLMASNGRQGGPIQAPATGRTRIYGSSPGLDQRGYDEMAARVRTAEQGVARQAGDTEHTYSARLDDARGQAIGLARHGEETADSFGQRIRDALASAQQSVLERAHDLQGHVGDAAGSIGSAAQGAVRSIGDAAQRAGGALAQGGQAAGQSGSNLVATIAESPVLLGALGLAAGALLGAFLPQLDQEEAALGGIAGKVRDTARDLAQNAVDKGGNVAQAVLDSGADSAQTHGLAGGKSIGSLVDTALSGDLAGHAKQVAQDVLRAGDEAIRKEVGPNQSASKPS